MLKNTTDYRERWWRRILQERRQTFVQRIWNRKAGESYNIKEILSWIWEDLKYISTWIPNILLQLRAYGGVIQQKYGLSRIQQFYRLSYLAFYHQVNPTSLRGRRLYLQESWEKVDDYTYMHDRSQFLLAEKSFPDEIEILENKFEFFRFCRSKGISTPEILAIYENGKRVWPEDLKFRLPHKNLFLKSLDGNAGQGIRRMMWSGKTFKDQHEKEYTPEELSDLLAEESKKNGIILQNVMVNHPSWSGFTSGAFVTCRIVTAKSPDDGSVFPLFTTIKLPVGKAYIDNFSKGGFYSGIDKETGKMGLAYGLRPVNGGFNFTLHPDTRQKIEGEKIPFWQDILQFAIHIHSQFNTIFVGWDIGMTENGPIVVEGNIGWASRSYECTHLEPLCNTEYPILYEKWLEKFPQSNE
ncbi:MAG: sugar-transfer associated ATP-grasp domain-containing protein [Balneolaceae bacterium]|nr:sugar-transfer associated ATP-grasp domain-containing protein [Balneolaceae bacterium]